MIPEKDQRKGNIQKAAGHGTGGLMGARRVARQECPYYPSLRAGEGPQPEFQDQSSGKSWEIEQPGEKPSLRSRMREKDFKQEGVEKYLWDSNSRLLRANERHGDRASLGDELA